MFCFYFQKKKVAQFPSLLGTVDSSGYPDIWNQFDIYIQDTFNLMIKVNNDKCQWYQAQLPVSMGGIGQGRCHAWDGGVHVISRVNGGCPVSGIRIQVTYGHHMGPPTPGESLMDIHDKGDCSLQFPEASEAGY